MSATSSPAPTSDVEALFSAPLSEVDPEIAEAIQLELGRQRDEIELIASENIVSRAVLEAQGSVLTNKYAEGLPGKRYYGGCQFVDIAERLAIERVTKAVRLQVRQCAAAFRRVGQCGSVLRADAAGRHLHGAQSRRRRASHPRHGRSTCRANGSSRCPTTCAATISRIDMDEVERLAHEHKPKLIIAGGSAYPRIIDFRRFREICDEVGALSDGRHGAFRRPGGGRRASRRRSRTRMS